MHRVMSAASLTLSLLIVSPVAAQEAPPPAVVITTSPNQVSPSPGYFQYELEDAKERSRRVRIALISTSAAAAVGMIVGATAFRHCEFIYSSVNQRDDLVCTQRGDALLAAGGTIFGLAAIGMITSGIMLGVRNKQKREIERDMRRHYYGGRLQWDIPSGRLVF